MRKNVCVVYHFQVPHPLASLVTDKNATQQQFFSSGDILPTSLYLFKKK
jgi:hypothetical protein